MDRERLKNLGESLRKTSDAFRKLGEAVKTAGREQDRYAVADHPDLHALNLELNNLYGNSFD